MTLSTDRRFPEFDDEVYDLDRRIPFARALNGLARFEGYSRRLTVWLTRTVAPLAARFAASSWRVTPSAVLGGGDPFLLCLTRDEPREGLKLLVAEWMEYRRQTSTPPMILVLRVCPSAPDANPFRFVAPFWEQVQALKKQFRLSRARVFLWVRENDDPGDEWLLDRSAGLVAVTRGLGFYDPLEMALETGKPVIAPFVPDDDLLPSDYPYGFATRQAILRFIGEPRRRDTASSPWSIPEDFALARAFRRLAEDHALDRAQPISMKRIAMDQSEIVPTDSLAD